MLYFSKLRIFFISLITLFFILIASSNLFNFSNELLKKKINIPIINMPKEVYEQTKKTCKKNSKIGLLATEGTLKTGIYNKFFDKNYKLLFPSSILQKNSFHHLLKIPRLKHFLLHRTFHQIFLLRIHLLRVNFHKCKLLCLKLTHQL